MEPDIEIWDLDTLDVLEPTLVLGGPKDSDRGQKPQLEDGGGKKKRKLRKGSHKNSVLSLAWNATVQNVLASGSADKTIKVSRLASVFLNLLIVRLQVEFAVLIFCCMQLWDLVKGECETTLSYHTDKVQSLAWNPQEAAVLLSGAFGGGVCICDTRGGESAVAEWAAGTDIESVAWGHSAAPTKFAVCTL